MFVAEFLQHHVVGAHDGVSLLLERPDALVDPGEDLLPFVVALLARRGSLDGVGVRVDLFRHVVKLSLESFSLFGALDRCVVRRLPFGLSGDVPGLSDILLELLLLPVQEFNLLSLRLEQFLEVLVRSLRLFLGEQRRRLRGASLAHGGDGVGVGASRLGALREDQVNLLLELLNLHGGIVATHRLERPALGDQLRLHRVQISLEISLGGGQ